VNADPDAIAGRLNEIRGRIAAAAAHSGRTQDSVTLIGVAKTVAVERIRQAIAAGLADVGENRVQEAEVTIAALGRGSLEWHMIGHLQRNKGSRALELFDRIHTLDSIELAESLSRKAAERGRRIPALIQINVSGEASKFGIAPEALEPVLERLLAMPGLAVDGLMSIGTPAEGPEDPRREFARLRELRDAAERALDVRLPQLSMGMSDDYEIAVEEGSTLVRVGRALFGARSAPVR
jgi:pyridoxal phosphate enzyme (YggS family)